MERLWAPWRMGYIKKHSDDAPCFLCAAAKGKRDARSHVLARGRTCFAILNKFPYSNGHLMITPYAHKGGIRELDDAERLELMSMAVDMQAALDHAFKPHGYNVGFNLGRVAGAGLLGHVHQHVVPRWNGDTNFLPVLGGVKVMPMTLDQVFQALKKALRR